MLQSTNLQTEIVFNKLNNLVENVYQHHLPVMTLDISVAKKLISTESHSTMSIAHSHPPHTPVDGSPNYLCNAIYFGQ